MKPTSILRDTLHDAAERADQPADLLGAVHRRVRRYRRRRMARVAAAVVLIVIAAVLTPVAVHHRSIPADVPVPVITRTQDIPELPLNRYITTTAQNTTILTAIRIEALACMATFGFADFHGADLLPGQVDSLRLGARTFEMINADDAAKYGYHVTPPSWSDGSDDTPHGAGADPVPTPSTVPPISPTSPTDSALANAIYNGDPVVNTRVNGHVVPAGGCEANAELAITTRGVDGDTYDVGSYLGSTASGESMGDPKVRAAVHAWSACMAAAGYTYDSPADPYNGGPYWDTLTVTPAEIADATANVRCKTRTNLVGIWWAAYARDQQRIIDANPAYFRAVIDYTTAVVARCAEIVAAGHPTGTILALAPPTMPVSVRATIPD